jgi:hypothetical protein
MAKTLEFRRPWMATRICLGIVLVANIVALGFAWSDQSWGALAIAMVVAPVGNAILALVSLLVAIPFVNTPAFPLRWHALLSLVVPAAMAGGDYLAIFAMPLHGC